MIDLKEKQIFKTDLEIEKMSTCVVSSLVSELQANQVELQAQNEELKLTQNELQKSRDRYFDLYNFAPAGYFTIDEKFVIINCNLTATRLFNKKRTDIIGCKIESLITPEDHQAYFQQTNDLIGTKKRQSCVLKMPKGDNDFIYARMESDFFPDENGIINQCSVFLDVTPCIIAEKELNQTVEALTKTNLELERFAYVASHDLREPLRNISSCAQMLEINYNNELDLGARALLRYITEGVTQINLLISDLLTYSRNSNTNSHFHVVDCNSILQNVLENLKQLIRETGAVITFDELPEAVADGTQISQIFQNLIGNAIKHHNGVDIKIHVGVQEKEGYLFFYVKDNGSGIEEEYLEKIFEIFKRLDTRSKYKGTGIGLAICRQVAENHGGKIWAESSIGNGSTFYFTLPVK